MGLRVSALVQLAAELTNPQSLTTASAPVSVSRQFSFVDGAGAGAVDRIWSARRVIAASATDSLDLAASLVDPFGATLTFARIKGLIVAAAQANTNNVLITRPASNAVPLLSTAGNLPVQPGGVFMWLSPSAAGVPVTAGTGDLLDLVNSGGGTSVTCDVVIIGAAS